MDWSLIAAFGALGACILVGLLSVGQSIEIAARVLSAVLWEEDKP